MSVRCFDSHPERDVVTEMRRDNNNVTQNESFTIVFDTFLDLTQRSLLPDDAARHLSRSGDRRRRAEFELEHRVGRPNGEVRRWMERRVRDSVQVAPLPGAGATNLGRELPPRRQMEERVQLPDRDARVVWNGQRHWAHGTGGNDGGARDAGGLQESRAQAVRRGHEHEPNRTAAVPFSNDVNGNGGFDFKYQVSRDRSSPT
ncbi:MAG: hypothetical protein QM736_14975 [Vicinamibacterales bacterium]